MTLDDIAKELGVSKSTVSRVINGTGRVGQDTKDRINDWIRKYNYVPNSAAKSLASNKTYNIGVVLPKNADNGQVPFFQECLVNISETLAPKGYDVIVIVNNGDDVESLERVIRNHKIDGVIMTRIIKDDKIVPYLKQNEIPFVLIGTTKDNQINQIDSDHIQGCSELISKFIQLGKKDFCLLAGSKRHMVNQYRYKGVMLSFKNANIKLDEKDIVWNINSKNGPDINEALKNINIKTKDCIICMDDSICINLLGYINDNQECISDSTQIISLFDNSYFNHTRKKIATLNTDIEELSNKAVECILKKIVNNEEYDQIKIAYKLKFINC